MISTEQWRCAIGLYCPKHSHTPFGGKHLLNPISIARLCLFFLGGFVLTQFMKGYFSFHLRLQALLKWVVILCVFVMTRETDYFDRSVSLSYSVEINVVLVDLL